MEGLAKTTTSTIPRRPQGVLGPHTWQLPDKYESRRVIGTGAMGTVVLARDRNLDRLVAIKTLRTDCTTFLGRLRREARMLSRLEHPAIVRVHDLDLHDGRLFLAMEYAPGGNLALARLEPVPLVRTLRSVVDALAHAHAHGIVHRDVKPENILLLASPGRPSNGRGPAVLSDFGLACGADEGSAALRSLIVGTPLTMSPEQVNGVPVGPASDVFSLGVTFYRQLTGRWPFRGRTVSDVFDAIRYHEPDPMANVPRRLATIVRRTLDKDPVARFGTAGELGRELDRFLRARSLFSFAKGGRLERAATVTPSGPHIHPEDVS